MLSTGSAGKDNDVSAKQKLQKAVLSIGGNEKYSSEVIILMTEMSTIALDIMTFLFVIKKTHYIVLLVLPIVLPSYFFIHMI